MIMSLVKLATEQKKDNWFVRHPVLTAGAALTSGIAASDAGLNLYKHLKSGGLLRNAGSTVKEGLKEGALYGGILSTVEPVVQMGLTRKRPERE